MRDLIVCVLLLCSAGCSPGADKPEPGTQNQRARDSAIGATRLPGASGVRGALRAADSAEARRRQEDSIERDP